MFSCILCLAVVANHCGGGGGAWLVENEG